MLPCPQLQHATPHSYISKNIPTSLESSHNHIQASNMGAAASTNSYYYELMAELEKKPSPPQSLSFGEGRQEVIRLREIMRGAYEEMIANQHGNHHDNSRVASKSTGFSHYYRGSTVTGDQHQGGLRSESEVDDATRSASPAAETFHHSMLSRAASGSVLAGHGIPSDVSRPSRHTHIF